MPSSLGLHEKELVPLSGATVSVTATQRTLPGRAASRAVLEVPQSYIDLQTLKAAGLRVWLTNRRNLGAEILPLGTVTDRCWHILNYWKLLKNNRLLEKHKGLRDARAGAGASGQAALPRGPPCPPAGGHPALPSEATPPSRRRPPRLPARGHPTSTGEPGCFSYCAETTEK